MIEQLEVFPSTFYKLIIDPDACVNLLSEIESKENRMRIISNATETKNVNEYITDYQHPVKLEWFEKIFNQAVVTQFDKITLVRYWTAIYNANGVHEKHNHRSSYYSNINYSGILYLSNLGGTHFFTPNPTSLVQVIPYESKFGTMVLFPSSIIHEVFPHDNDSNKRYIVAFNMSIDSV